jgi:hypothetical protein
MAKQRPPRDRREAMRCVHSAVATYKASQSPYLSGAAYKEDAGSVFRAPQKGGEVTSGRCT